jgi:hypothetical protein
MRELGHFHDVVVQGLAPRTDIHTAAADLRLVYDIARAFDQEDPC